MATGGTYIRSCSVKGSDEFYPYMCSPCCRKDIDIRADAYCIQCEEYLCGRCLDNHNSFAKMLTHAMLDGDQMETKGPHTIQPLMLTVPCDLHQGQMYTLFCEKHNQVCCAVCYPVNHRSCEVKYILDIAEEAMQGPELNEFRRAMNEILQQLEKVKRQRESDLYRMTTERESELNQIHTSVQQMIKHLEGIEAFAIDEVTRKFTEYKTKIENDLTKLSTMINTLNTKLDKLEKAKDDAEKFVHIKISEDDKFSARNLIEDIGAHVGEEKLVFLIDERVEEAIKKLDYLGKLALNYQYAVTPEGQHRVDTENDGKVCDITDICQAEDGSILMTDWANECLKRLDERYKVFDCLKLNDYTQGVCSVSASQVAVCLINSKTVQLVTLNPNMSKSSSFKTTDRCRGIAHHADHLYVTCGGWIDKGEDPGHIAVYTISGTLVRRLATESRGQLSSSVPLDVAVRRTDGVILVCDLDNGLVARGPDGQRLWAITCRDLQVGSANMVTLDSHGQALVSSWRSNKVVLVSRDGRNLGAVLTDRDGINKPQGLCVDVQRSMITVGMDRNNEISVFKLS